MTCRWWLDSTVGSCCFVGGFARVDSGDSGWAAVVLLAAVTVGSRELIMVTAGGQLLFCWWR